MRGGVRELRCQRGRRDDDRGARIGNDEGNSFRRIGGVEGQIGTPRLVNGKHGDHEIDGARQRDPDHRIDPDLQLDQRAGQRAGSLVQGRVVDGVGPAQDRNVARCQQCPIGAEAGERIVRRDLHAGSTSRRDQPLVLLGADDRQRADRLFDVAIPQGCQSGQALRKPQRLGGVDQPGVVSDGDFGFTGCAPLADGDGPGQRQSRCQIRDAGRQAGKVMPRRRRDIVHQDIEEAAPLAGQSE